MPDFDLIKKIRDWLREDIGRGDITSSRTVPPGCHASASVITRESVVISGIDVCRLVFAELQPDITFTKFCDDGDRVKGGTRLAVVEGNAQAILAGERLALNLLQRLCSIATKARHLAELIAENPDCQIVDTRKTTPGLRKLEKAAVVHGGCANHRFGLDDGILIKDNHIRCAGGIAPAVANARRTTPHLIRIEVEAENLEQVEQALRTQTDAILLDNMPLAEVQEAVQCIRRQSRGILIEVSGGIGETDIAQLAAAGVNLISMGSLTHSVKAVDIHLHIEPDILPSSISI